MLEASLGWANPGHHHNRIHHAPPASQCNVTMYFSQVKRPSEEKQQMTIRNFPLFHMPCLFPYCSVDLWRLPCSSTARLAPQRNGYWLIQGGERPREAHLSNHSSSWLLSWKEILLQKALHKGLTEVAHGWVAPGQKPVDPVNFSCSWGKAWAAGCRS